MSIQTSPMKAVPLLLKQLMTVERHADLNDLKSELINIKDLFFIVKKNEEELLDTLTVLHGYLRNYNIHKLMEEKEDICKRIQISTQKLLPTGAIENIYIEPGHSSGNRDVKLDEKEQVSRALRSSLQHLDLGMIKVNYINLDGLSKRCFWSLLLLSQNAVIKKRTIILWWVGLGFVEMKTQKNAKENNGEDVFDKLLHYEQFLQHGNHKYSGVNKFKINPLVHHKSIRPLLQNDEQQFCGIYSQIITSPHRSDTQYTCLALDQRKVNLNDGFGFKSNHWRAIFNGGTSYLDFGPGWMAKMKILEVLQLGRWLHDSPKHHIEVDSEEFLKELKDQKHLKYLGLHGISRISELPPSIFQLESLQTLDLKACHNLETLPDDIASLRNLRHLDLSRLLLVG